jgi:hypothetical protein
MFTHISCKATRTRCSIPPRCAPCPAVELAPLGALHERADAEVDYGIFRHLTYRSITICRGGEE